MTVDAGSFENRYLSPKFIDFWMSDQGMEAVRSLWRKKLISLLPFELSDNLRVLDLGTGTGALSLEILNRYPNVQLTCQDFSEIMLSHARQQLAQFEGKVTFVQSNLQNPGWAQTIEGTFNAVVSSFVTHTVPNNVKGIYQELFGLVNPGGCFLSCDIFNPSGPILEGIYHKSRLMDYQNRIKVKTGIEKSLQEVEQQLRERRQGYKSFFKDRDGILSISTPTIMNHLEWLKEAGFDEVDCLQKRMRNAIIGGFKH